MIERMPVEYAIKELCQALEVSRSGSYQWRQPGPTTRQEENQQLVEQIQEIHQEHQGGRYGSPRMTVELRERGFGCGRNRGARLMRQHGIVARRECRFRPRTTDRGPVVALNLLGERDPPSEPNHIWVSDITYIGTQEGWLYLAVVLDLCSRRVLGWSLEETREAALVAGAMQRAIPLREPEPGLFFQSDRGSQYSSQKVRQLLEGMEATQSMSAAGNCYDNATCEAFFSSLKTECLPEKGVFTTKEVARRSIFEYLAAYYNTKRRHSSLGYRMPCQFEEDLKEIQLAIKYQREQGKIVTTEDRAPLESDPSAGVTLPTVGPEAAFRQLLSQGFSGSTGASSKAKNPREFEGQSPSIGHSHHNKN